MITKIKKKENCPPKKAIKTTLYLDYSTCASSALPQIANQSLALRKHYEAFWESCTGMLNVFVH